MRVKQLIPFCGILLAVLTVVFGCSFGVTLQQRVNAFLAALNNDDRTDLYSNLDPNLPDYEALKDPAYWGEDSTSGWFPTVSGDAPYILTDTSIDDQTDPTVPVFIGDLSGPSGYGVAKMLQLTFVKVGMDWMIETMVLGVDVVVAGP
jgi:hypothetical protein